MGSNPPVATSVHSESVGTLVAEGYAGMPQKLGSSHCAVYENRLFSYADNEGKASLRQGRYTSLASRLHVLSARTGHPESSASGVKSSATRHKLSTNRCDMGSNLWVSRIGQPDCTGVAVEFGGRLATRRVNSFAVWLIGNETEHATCCRPHVSHRGGKSRCHSTWPQLLTSIAHWDGAVVTCRGSHGHLSAPSAVGLGTP
jgi:hypothetical protein